MRVEAKNPIVHLESQICGMTIEAWAEQETTGDGLFTSSNASSDLLQMTILKLAGDLS